MCVADSDGDVAVVSCNQKVMTQDATQSSIQGSGPERLELKKCGTVAGCENKKNTLGSEKRKQGN